MELYLFPGSEGQLNTRGGVRTTFPVFDFALFSFDIALTNTNTFSASETPPRVQKMGFGIRSSV